MKAAPCRVKCVLCQKTRPFSITSQIGSGFCFCAPGTSHKESFAQVVTTINVNVFQDRPRAHAGNEKVRKKKLTISSFRRCASERWLHPRSIHLKTRQSGAEPATAHPLPIGHFAFPFPRPTHAIYFYDCFETESG